MFVLARPTEKRGPVGRRLSQHLLLPLIPPDRDRIAQIRCLRVRIDGNRPVATEPTGPGYFERVRIPTAGFADGGRYGGRRCFLQSEGPVSSIKIGPGCRFPSLIDMNELVGDDLGAERFWNGVWNNDAIAGPGVWHAGLTGFGCRDDVGAIAAFLDIFHGTVVTLAAEGVGCRPGGYPGKIAGIIVGFEIGDTVGTEITIGRGDFATGIRRRHHAYIVERIEGFGALETREILRVFTGCWPHWIFAFA